MIRSWKMLGLTAALAAALINGRGAAEAPGAGPDSAKPDDLRQELEQFRSDTIRSFQAAKKDIDAVKEDIARLRKDLNEARNARPPAPRISGDVPPEARIGANAQAAQKDIDALKEQIARLDKSLDDLHNARPPATRISAYPPSGTVAGTGTIRLSNTYSAEVAIIVNDERYTLAPGETRVLAGRPAGTFTYEVVGVQPAVERTLVANGTFPILVHP
jgi:polyhydroxyalkanoate synthesis regulator phasin